MLMLNSRIRMVVTTTFHVLALIVLSGGLNDLRVIVAGVNLGPRGLRSSSASANGANDNGGRNGRGAGTDPSSAAGGGRLLAKETTHHQASGRLLHQGGRRGTASPPPGDEVDVAKTSTGDEVLVQAARGRAGAPKDQVGNLLQKFRAEERHRHVKKVNTQAAVPGGQGGGNGIDAKKTTTCLPDDSSCGEQADAAGRVIGDVNAKGGTKNTTPGSATRTEKDRPAGPTTGPHWGPLEAAPSTTACTSTPFPVAYNDAGQVGRSSAVIPSTTACTSTPFPVAYNDAGQVGQSWCAGGGHGRADEDGNAVGGKFDLARDKGFVGKKVLVLLLGRSAANTIELGSSENPVAKKFWDGSATPSGLYREKGDVVVALERKGFNVTTLLLGSGEQDADRRAAELLDDPQKHQLSQVWFVSGINPESGKHCPFRTWDSVDYTDTVDDTRKWMSRALVQRVRRFWKLFGGGIAVWMNRYPFISGANFFHWLVADEAEFDIERSAAAPTPDGAWGCNGENKKQALLEFYDNDFGKQDPPDLEKGEKAWSFWPSKDITAQPESESRADPAKAGGIVEGHPITTCIAKIPVGEGVSALVTQETPGAEKENRSKVHGGKVTPLMYGKDERPTKRRRDADGKDADKAFALSGTWEDVDGVEALEGGNEEDRKHGRSEDDACKNAGKRFRGRVFGDGGYSKLGSECGYCGDGKISSGAERYVVNVAAWLDAGRWQ